MSFLSAGNSAREAAELAYRSVVAQARQPVFFTDYGVPDTLDGRFELICLHAFLYLHRLKAERPLANRLCQSFFDTMFADFDRSLREMGTGDLSVGKHVKRMARAFYGRILAYEEGLGGDEAVLSAAVSRNIFGTKSGSPPAIGATTTYIRNSVTALASQPASELLAGRPLFQAPPAWEPMRNHGRLRNHDERSNAGILPSRSTSSTRHQAVLPAHRSNR